MTAIGRYTLAAVAVMILVGAGGETVRGFAVFGSKWNDGAIAVHLQMGPGSGTLIDGSTSWNQVLTTAIDTWNGHVQRVQMIPVQNSTSPRRDGDEINQVFLDSGFYGRRFEADTLAITTRWVRGSTQRVEGDIVFNNQINFNSYRGPVGTVGGRVAWDMRRVALHELGHLLGLGHPDEQGQNVGALMNSLIGDRDSLATDDVAGARSLYSTSVTSNVSFPPRNEPADFFAQLGNVYRDVLRAAAVPTYVDAEGAVVWLSEYARYRVGLCSHSAASALVFSQIDNLGMFGVCALTPPVSIPFPPRDEGLDFMIQLDAKYRDGLRRAAVSSFVNNEGAVVWVLEYFRYRLNGCNHGDATAKVLTQIRGGGIQPLCR